MTPEQVDRCSPWQLAAAVAGWNACHGGEPKAPELTDAEYEDLMLRHG